jgi:transposase InsO family protein
LMEKIFLTYGFPRCLLSDRGKVFQSDLIREITRLLGVKSQYTTAYHPQCNGLTERANKTMVDMLAMYVNTQQTDWSDYISYITFAYNSSCHDSAKYSPFMLMFAREPVLPAEAMLTDVQCQTDAAAIREKALAMRYWATQNITSRQEKDRVRFNEKHRELNFQPGDKVKIFTPIRKVGRSEKLLLKWFGPFTIIRKIGEVNYEVRRLNVRSSKTDIVHVSRILPYYDEWTSYTPVEDGDLEEINEPVNKDDDQSVNKTDSQQAATASTSTISQKRE